MENNYNVQPLQPVHLVPQIRTDRNLLKVILLSLITCGIYPLFFYTSLTDDVNTMCTPYDGKKSMHYLLLMFVVAPLTLGIGTFVWLHNISNRIGDELRRRNINYSFSAKDFWLWYVLGSLLLGFGPLIYSHMLLTAVNLLASDYNACG